MGIFTWRIFVCIVATGNYFTPQNIQHSARGRRIFRMKNQAVKRGVWYRW